jgi:glycogen debranching enzyme
LVVDMTNPDLLRGEQIVLPRGSLHLARVRHLWDGAMWERLVILNCARDEVPVDLLLQFAFDFADIFEVRGSPRRRLPAPVASASELTA